eukprot:4574152-Alexandrium_andersonii.AAC.1
MDTVDLADIARTTEAAERDLKLRELARVQYLAQEAKEKIQRIQTHRSRPQRGPYQAGDRVLVFRRSNAILPHRGQWRGPGVVIAVEGSSAIYVQLCSRLYKCAPEQLRPLSPQERQVASEADLRENVLDTDGINRLVKGVDIRSEAPDGDDLDRDVPVPARAPGEATARTLPEAPAPESEPKRRRLTRKQPPEQLQPSTSSSASATTMGPVGPAGLDRSGPDRTTDNAEMPEAEDGVNAAAAATSRRPQLDRMRPRHGYRIEIELDETDVADLTATTDLNNRQFMHSLLAETAVGNQQRKRRLELKEVELTDDEWLLFNKAGGAKEKEWT